jgi:hypothetical protein
MSFGTISVRADIVIGVLVFFVVAFVAWLLLRKKPETPGIVPQVKLNALGSFKKLCAFWKPICFALLIGTISLLISHNYFGEKSFWHVFFHEIGFALLVATTIWIAFEFFSHIDAEDHWNARIEQISKNVFFGVWKKNFPDGLIKQAGRLILDQDFVRTDMHLVYTLSDASFTLGAETLKFVKLNTVATCKVRNISNDKAMLPLGIGLPNPMINELKLHCCLNKLVIKRGGKIEPIPTKTWDDALVKFKTDLDNDKCTVARMKLGEISLAPNEELEMILDYNMAKEAEDTEVFTTRFPVDSVTFTISDRGPTKREVRARSIHTEDLENDTSSEAGATYVFRLPHWLLPEQGFVIWWKDVPNRPSPNPSAT